jgi:hypothetical protein
MLGAALIGAGVATLVHAGYSAIHFQSLIEARYGEVAASLPLDVYAELALAVGLVLAGVAVSVKSFSPLYSDSEPAVKCVPLDVASTWSQPPLPASTPPHQLIQPRPSLPALSPCLQLVPPAVCNAARLCARPQAGSAGKGVQRRRRCPAGLLRGQEGQLVRGPSNATTGERARGPCWV